MSLAIRKEQKMTKTISPALVFSFLATALYAAPVTNATSEELQLLRDYASEMGTKIDASEAEINESIGLMKEGTAFFIFLLSTNALPETASETVTNSVAALDPPSFTVTYPVKVRVDAKRIHGDIHIYSLIKSSPSNTWVVADGWEEIAGEQASSLKLPTEADQIKANESLPTMMQTWNDEEGQQSGGAYFEPAAGPKSAHP